MDKFCHKVSGGGANGLNNLLNTFNFVFCVAAAVTFRFNPEHSIFIMHYYYYAKNNTHIKSIRKVETILYHFSI